MADLDRNSFKPIYYQLSENLRAVIDGGLSPGDQIPSENELITQYGVSRNTARLAIDILVREGLVYRVKGKGTFVAPERMRFGLLRLTSFTEEMRRRGLQPGSRLLNMSRTAPPAKIANRLQLAPGALTFVIERLRLANGEPLALHTTYVPQAVCPRLAEENLTIGSLYQILEDTYGLRIGHAEQLLKPTVATEYEAKILEVPPGSPLQLVEVTSFLENGAPFEYSKLLYRGDRYEFPIKAVRHSAAGRGPEDL